MINLRSREMSQFYDKLAQLQRAGVPLREGLRLASAGVRTPELRQALLAVQTQVARGAPLTEAVTACPQAFSALEAALIGVGEMNGRLDRSLGDLAVLMGRRYAAQRKLLSALSYPLVLLVLAALLPPLPTWFTSGFPAYLRAAMAALVPLLVPLGAFYFLLRIRALPRRALDRLALAVPILSGVVRRLALARFCRALSALLAGGVVLQRGLELARQALDNRVLYERSAAAQAALDRGETLALSLEAAGVFPAELLSMVAVGETSGELDRALDRAAELYEMEAEQTMAALLRLLPVLVLLLVAVRIAAVVIGGHGQRMDELIGCSRIRSCGSTDYRAILASTDAAAADCAGTEAPPLRRSPR
jgi:type II secretory pathway component PulF